MTISVGDKVGSYEILAPIGKGGMGEVYRARDTRLNRDVAIKFSAERFTEHSQREARVIASLNHLNVCHLYDVGPNYLVMELVDGPTLAERINQGAMPLDEALHVARQIAEALEAAHEKGVVHRDLKPGNVKIRPDGVVKVLDFGLAKATAAPTSGSDDSPTMNTALSQPGMILGTAAYMSPEQARGQLVDKRTDIWAFGAVLYEMVTGNRLFQGQTITEVLASVLKEEPKWENVPLPVRRLLQRCLAKDPQQRMRHIGDAMELVSSEAPAEVSRRSRNRSWIWIAATAALVLVGVAALWGPWPSQPDLQLTSFEIQPTAKTPFRNTGNPSVSPNGKWVVFGGRGADGVLRYWLRALGSVEVKPLAGTETTAAVPAIWSPDSGSIAFFSPGQFKKLDLSGGITQKISDIPQGVSSGSWNRNHVILFAVGAADAGIMRVNAKGGVPSPVTVPDPSRRESSHRAPQFLPDGRHFLYYRASLDPRYAGVYVGSIDSSPENQDLKPVLLSDRQAWYAPSVTPGKGFLVFLRETTLFAQAFDPDLLEMSGEEFRVADQVHSLRGVNAGFFSVSENGVLAYRVGISGEQSQLTWVNRTGDISSTAGEKGRYSGPSIAPDGDRIAVSRVDARTGYSNILVIEASGQTRPLTFNRSRDSNPVWSPDGNNIVFSSDIEGQMNLYRKASDGSGEEQLLLKSDQDKFPTSFSVEGFLLYTSVDSKTQQDLWVLPRQDGSEPIPFLRTEFREQTGVFSPDGRWIAYVSDESGIDEVWVRPFSGNKVEQSSAGTRWKVSIGGGITPRWGTEGKELFYTFASQGFVVDITTGDSFHAGGPRTLPGFRPGLVAPDVSSDGKRFLRGLTEPADPLAPIIVLLNWQSGLKK